MCKRPRGIAETEKRLFDCVVGSVLFRDLWIDNDTNFVDLLHMLP